MRVIQAYLNPEYSREGKSANDRSGLADRITMKILFVLNEYYAENNGLSISAQRFVNELRGLGHDVQILAGNVRGTPMFALKEYRIPIFDELIKKQGMTFAEADDEVITKAVEWCDLVHLEDCFVLSHHAAKIARSVGRPCTGAFHMYPENITSSIKLQWFYPLNAAIILGLRDYVYRYCSDIHCPTKYVSERIRRYGYNQRLHVISNGVTSEFDIGRGSENVDKPFTILSIGRYSREKRQDVIIEAVARSRHADEIRLVLAGQGPLEEKYRRLAKKLPNGCELGFMNKPELIRSMGEANLYIHAAEAEVEGMSCMEAIASGLVPIIAQSAKSSTPQYALDERSLFRSGDSRELAERIDYWFEHNAERRAMEAEYAGLMRGNTVHDSALLIEKMFLDAYEEYHGKE